MRKLKVFRDIDELLTLSRAAKKKGRKPTELDLSIIKNGAFVAAGSKVLWVGKTKELSSSLLSSLGPVSKEYSLKGYSVLPAFVECHTHLIFAGDRSDEFELRNQGVSYQEIAKRGGGILSTMKATKKASEKELVELGQKRVQRFIEQGVSTIEIKSGYALDKPNELKILKAAKQLNKARTVLTYLGPHAVPNNFKSADSYLQFVMDRVLPIVAKEKLAERVDMFIEKGYFNCEHAKAFFEKSKELGLGITAHVEQLSRTGGAKVATHFGAQSVDHLVQINKTDIKNLAQSESTCVLLPGADFYLKMKYPPARQLIDAGARVALATDFNPGSCPTQDLSLIGFLARQEMKMSLAEVLVAYTVGASYALDKGLELGSIEAGKSCDFLVLDSSWKELYYSVGNHPVLQTWRGGRRIFSKS